MFSSTKRLAGHEAVNCRFIWREKWVVVQELDKALKDNYKFTRKRKKYYEEKGHFEST